MATGYINLFPGGNPPDGSGSINNPAAMDYEVSAAAQGSNSPKASQLKLLFDPTTDEHWLFQLELPGDYASAPVLRGKIKFTSATSGNAIMKAAAVATTDSSTDDDALAFGTADVSAAVAAPATQGQVIEFTIAITAALAANRKVLLFVGRDADNGSDTATGDVELLSLNFEYTTT
jgi:hypothetical protein